MTQSVDAFLERLKRRDPDRPEFHQAVEEVLRSSGRSSRPTRTTWKPASSNASSNPSGRSCSAYPGSTTRAGTGQPWLPGADEQRHRPLQGRLSASIPRSTSGCWKFLAFEQVFKNSPDHSAHGRRQEAPDFDPKGKERRRGDAFLPVVHERAVPATSAPTWTCRPATSASARVRSATCSASTSACPTSSPRC